MFTGIVTSIGTVKSAEQRGDLRLVVETDAPFANAALGASIACSGVCLTIVDLGADWFALDLSAETLSRTASGLWAKGSRLNLERPLRLGDELGGHMVTGHVDAVGEIVSSQAAGDSLTLAVRLPVRLAPMVAPKGSITFDGVSLTANSIIDSARGPIVDVNVIPHTANHTTLGAAAPGRQLNVEIDVLARYLERMIAVRAHSS